MLGINDKAEDELLLEIAGPSCIRVCGDGESATDATEDKTLSIRRKYFVSKFKERLELKWKNYYYESIGDSSKAGDTAGILMSAINEFRMIPSGGRMLAVTMQKGIALVGEDVHKKKAEIVTGRLEDIEKEDILKIIVGSGVNIFFALESQLMKITKENYPAGWEVAFTVIAKELVARANAYIFSNREFILSEKSLSECALNFNYKRRLENFQNIFPDWILPSDFILRRVLKKVGVFIEDEEGNRKYFWKGEKYTKEYGYRRLFPGEEKSTEKYSETDQFPSSYKYLMLKERLSESKASLVEVIREKSKSNKDRLKEIEGKFEQLDMIQEVKEVQVRMSKILGKNSEITRLLCFAKFVNLPQGLLKFLEGGESCNICVIFSLDCDVTAERLKDAGGMTVLNWKNCNMVELTGKIRAVAFTHVDNVEEMVKSGLEKKRKLIIVTKGKEKVVEKKEDFETKVVFIEENLSWQDLSKNYKKELLKRKVIVQGHELTLTEWIQVTGSYQSENNISGQLLIDLVNNKRPVLFKNTLPEKLHYYVNRRLRSRRVLCKNKIFGDGSNAVFAFTGLEKYKWSGMVGNGRIMDTARNQIKKQSLSVRYILLECKSEFELLCEKTKEPVHWVHRDGNDIFTWVKSRGEMNVIRGMVEDDGKQDEYYEKELIRLIPKTDLVHDSEQHAIISDTVGTGKSVLLEEIGRQILIKNPKSFVIFEELPKFVKSVSKNFPNEESPSANVLIEHLASSMMTSGFSESCVQSALKGQSVKVSLLLDAYDEVHLEDVSLCKKMLKVLQLSPGNNIRVFITSRGPLLHELENIFEVLAWSIVPFTESDMSTFYTSFWQHVPEERKNEEGEMKFQRLEVYTRNFITALKNKWDEKERAIVGTPLLCYLVAEVFHNEILNGCSCSTGGHSINSFELLAKIGSLTNLYSRLVEKRIRVFKEKCPETLLDSGRIHKWHAAQAFRDLFPEVEYKGLVGEEEASLQEMGKIGILEEKGDGRMSFVHQSFAEYFVAKALSDIFTSDHPISHKFKSCLGSLVRTLLKLSSPVDLNNMKIYDFEKREILYHLEALLKNKKIVGQTLFDVNCTKENLTKLSFSLVYAKLANIFKLLVDSRYFEEDGLIFSEELLFCSVMYSSFEVVTKVGEKFSKLNAKSSLDPIGLPKRSGSCMEVEKLGQIITT